MSFRITRSAARNAANTQSLGSPAIAAGPGATSLPPHTSRKRKASAREPSPDPEHEPAKAASSRRPKRQKVLELEPPLPAQVAPIRRKKGKIPAVMSSPG